MSSVFTSIAAFISLVALILEITANERENFNLRLWREKQRAKNRFKSMSNVSSLSNKDFIRLEALNNKLKSKVDYYANSSLQPPHEILSQPSFYHELSVPMTESERNGSLSCNFLAAHCPMERVEHTLVQKFIDADDTVLELGARFGTTSCEITSKQNNSGRIVAVEPDRSVWHILAHNRHLHRCNFWILRGMVSNHQQTLVPMSYGTRTMQIGAAAQQAAHLSQPIPYLSFDAIEKATGLKFTTLLIDCEGCIDTLFTDQELISRGEESILRHLAQVLKHIRTIILEADMSHIAPDCYRNCVHYDIWQNRLGKLGFAVILQRQDPHFWFINHLVFRR